MNEYQYAMSVMSMLMRREDFHAVVEWRAFSRHMPIVVLFISFAWSLDINTALTFAFILWIALVLLRGSLWEGRVTDTEFWNVVLPFRSMILRWPIIWICIGIVWWRSSAIFQQVWPWLVGIFVFDFLCTLFNESRGHAEAVRQIRALEQEYDRLRSSSESAS